jgi:hypothetical protein
MLGIGIGLPFVRSSWASGAGYTIYMLEPVAIREVTGDPSWQITEFILYFEDAPVDLSGAEATNPEGDGGLNPEHPEEGPLSAIDGDLNTKFLDHNIKPLVVTFPERVRADAWSYVTGNDAIDRDIVQWRVWGSNSGVNWTLLQSQLVAYDVTASRKAEVGPFDFGTFVEDPLE